MKSFACLRVLCRNSLSVQWLGLGAFTAGGLGSIPCWGTKILTVTRHGKKKKGGGLEEKKESCGSNIHFYSITI